MTHWRSPQIFLTDEKSLSVGFKQFVYSITTSISSNPEKSSNIVFRPMRVGRHSSTWTKQLRDS